MPVVGLSGPRCSASVATSSVNFCFSFTTRSRPLCSHSRWRLSLDVVTWSDATKIGLQHRPNARYPAPFWPWSTRKDHKPNSAIISEGAIRNIWRARGCIHVEETRVHHAARRRGGRVAARGAGTAANDAGDRVPQPAPAARAPNNATMHKPQCRPDKSAASGKTPERSDASTYTELPEN